MGVQICRIKAFIRVMNIHLGVLIFMKHLKFPRHFRGYIYQEYCQPGPALGKHFHLTQGLNYAHRRPVENNVILVQVQN